MRNTSYDFTMLEFIAAAIVFILLVGWTFNVYKLVRCDFDKPYKQEVIRLIGVIVPPVGGIIGYMDIEDGPESS